MSDSRQLPRHSERQIRADDEPQVGDLIRYRWPPRRKALCARRIIGISTGGEWVETTGVSGRQRNTVMSRDRLSAYVRLERGA